MLRLFGGSMLRKARDKVSGVPRPAPTLGGQRKKPKDDIRKLPAKLAQRELL